MSCNIRNRRIWGVKMIEKTKELTPKQLKCAVGTCPEIFEINDYENKANQNP